ncbi:MAG: DNA-binding response regulator [Desulfobacteraceae bacterium]|nr:MAG: DNA-binding response regulator [Desulfobacteraceae bacterium]
MKKANLLVVDDEEDILQLLKHHLLKEGYEVRCAASGEEALHMVRINRFSLILLDLMLPGMDGFEVTRILKSDASTGDIPIVMLTAKGDDTDIITGLEIGADDYVPKPFNPKVLIARIRAVLRRKASKANEDQPLQVNGHGIQVDVRRQEVRVEGKPVHLTLSEFCILSFLAQKPGWVFTRAQINEHIRGSGYAVTDRSVDVQIVGLRKKLAGAGENIETIRGVGYRFKPLD